MPTTSVSWAVLTLAIFIETVASLTCTTNPSPPNGTVCEVYGTQPANVMHINITEPFPTSSFAACRDISARIDRIDVFKYNTQTSLCDIYINDPKTVRFSPDPSSKTIYSQTACYICKETCPEPPSVNLLPNPGFEFSNTSFGPWQTNSVNLSSPGHNSATALMTMFNYGLDQTLRHLCLNTYYLVTFDYLVSPGAPPGSSIELYGTYEKFTVFVQAVNNTWTTVQDYVYIEGRNFADFHFGGVSQNNGVPLYLDNLGVYPLAATPTPAPNAPELLVNGGFETGSVAPWYDFSGTVVSPGVNSTYQLNFTGGGYIAQNLTLTPGTHYVLSLDYRKKGSNDAAFFFQLDLYPIGDDADYAGNSAFSLYFDHGPRNNTWVQPFVAHFAQTQLALRFQLNDCPQRCDHYKLFVDNISLKEMNTSM